jgi:hypothetical protein
MVKFFAYCIEKHKLEDEPVPEPELTAELKPDEWFFFGDTSSYIVEVLKSATKITSQVKILKHLDDKFSIPVGAKVIVSNRKLFKDFSNILKVRA